MADITEAEQWDTGVYQLETTDPVQGGVDGVDNIPHKALANRTVWLKAQLALKALLGGSATQTFKVAAAVNDDEAVNKLQMKDEISLNVPPSTIIVSPVSTVPTGFLECNGAELSRTTYSDLYAVIGDTYGAGDGSTTFNIPDLRGEFIRGFDNGRGVDSGRAIGTAQLDDFKSHIHDFDYSRKPAGSTRNSEYGGVDTSTNISYFNQTTNATGGAETRPRNIAMMYCIKY